jgi:hypothetical protein
MLHLLKSAVNPALTLQHCLKDWNTISYALRESSRKRSLQVENFEVEDYLLS